MTYVLDATALVAYLNDEDGADVVEDLLFDTRVRCYVHAVNLCEVYYDAVRRVGVSAARRTIDRLQEVGVIERGDMSRAFWQRVGDLKARGRLSLADCHCIALAQEIGGEVVTSDRREFGPLAPLHLCPIRFIR